MPESVLLRFIIVAIGVYLFIELIEHAVIPLIWLLLKKTRRSPTGASGLIGEVGVVKEWHESEG